MGQAKRRLLSAILCDFVIGSALISLLILATSPAEGFFPRSMEGSFFGLYRGAVGFVVFFYIFFLYIVGLILVVVLTNGRTYFVRVSFRTLLFVAFSIFIVFLSGLFDTKYLHAWMILVAAGVLTIFLAEFVSDRVLIP